MHFKRRSKVGRGSALFFALLFGALMTATAVFDLWVGGAPTAGTALSFTVRLPPTGVYRDTMTGGAQYRLQTTRYAPGSKLDPRTLRMIRSVEEGRRPPRKPLLAGLAAAFVLALFLYMRYLSALGGVLAHTRTQLTLLISLLVVVVASKGLLALTDWSGVWAPVTLLLFPVAMILGRRAAAATAMVSGMVVVLQSTIDFPALSVLLAQGMAATLVLERHASRGRLLGGAIVGGLAGVITHVAVTMILFGRPMPPAAFDIYSLLRADLVAAAGAPLIGGLLALALTGVIERGLGRLSKSRLVALADFENPLLKRISSVASGTWAHSLNMANMAEMAANRIHADALLCRVAAYYHDVGKTQQPEYFIENQQGKNPHDDMSPEHSADAIIAHVTEGVKLAQRAGIPEAIVEFIYTHHGNSLLEYFWHKTLKDGNPDDLEEKVFRYPGVPPQTREQGILAVTDAVEAASKTLKNPRLDQIQKLVRTIVFSKVEHGQLSESGLTIEELRQVTETLIEALRSAMHVRVKYPWQEDEEAAAKKAQGDMAQGDDKASPKKGTGAAGDDDELAAAVAAAPPSKPRLEPLSEAEASASNAQVVVEVNDGKSDPAWAAAAAAASDSPRSRTRTRPGLAEVPKADS